MRALTLIRPWCWAIAHAGKDVENRSWRPPDSIIGHRIAIHSGLKWDAAAASRVAKLSSKMLAPKEDWRGGRIVATAKVTGWTVAAASKWAIDGQVHWCLRSVFVLPTPVPCKGAQGLWTVPEDVERQILEQMKKGKT